MNVHCFYLHCSRTQKLQCDLKLTSMCHTVGRSLMILEGQRQVHKLTITIASGSFRLHGQWWICEHSSTLLKCFTVYLICTCHLTITSWAPWNSMSSPRDTDWLVDNPLWRVTAISLIFLSPLLNPEDYRNEPLVKMGRWRSTRVQEMSENN